MIRFDRFKLFLYINLLFFGNTTIRCKNYGQHKLFLMFNIYEDESNSVLSGIVVGKSEENVKGGASVKLNYKINSNLNVAFGLYHLNFNDLYGYTGLFFHFLRACFQVVYTHGFFNKDKNISISIGCYIGEVGDDEFFYEYNFSLNGLKNDTSEITKSVNSLNDTNLNKNERNIFASNINNLQRKSFSDYKIFLNEPKNIDKIQLQQEEVKIEKNEKYNDLMNTQDIKCEKIKKEYTCQSEKSDDVNYKSKNISNIHDAELDELNRQHIHEKELNNDSNVQFKDLSSIHRAQSNEEKQQHILQDRNNPNSDPLKMHDVRTVSKKSGNSQTNLGDQRNDIELSSERNVQQNSLGRPDENSSMQTAPMPEQNIYNFVVGHIDGNSKTEKVLIPQGSTKNFTVGYNQQNVVQRAPIQEQNRCNFVVGHIHGNSKTEKALVPQGSTKNFTVGYNQQNVVQTAPIQEQNRCNFVVGHIHGNSKTEKALIPQGSVKNFDVGCNQQNIIETAPIKEETMVNSFVVNSSKGDTAREVLSPQERTMVFNKQNSNENNTTEEYKHSVSQNIKKRDTYTISKFEEVETNVPSENFDKIDQMVTNVEKETEKESNFTVEQEEAKNSKLKITQTDSISKKKEESFSELSPNLERANLESSQSELNIENPSNGDYISIGMFNFSSFQKNEQFYKNDNKIVEIKTSNDEETILNLKRYDLVYCKNQNEYLSISYSLESQTFSENIKGKELFIRKVQDKQYPYHVFYFNSQEQEDRFYFVIDNELFRMIGENVHSHFQENQYLLYYNDGFYLTNGTKYGEKQEKNNTNESKEKQSQENAVEEGGIQKENNELNDNVYMRNGNIEGNSNETLINRCGQYYSKDRCNNLLSSFSHISNLNRNPEQDRGFDNSSECSSPSVVVLIADTSSICTQRDPGTPSEQSSVVSSQSNGTDESELQPEEELQRVELQKRIVIERQEQEMMQLLEKESLKRIELEEEKQRKTIELQKEEEQKVIKIQKEKQQKIEELRLKEEKEREKINKQAEDMMQLLKKEGLKRIELQKEEEQKRIELKEEKQRKTIELQKEEEQKVIKIQKEKQQKIEELRLKEEKEREKINKQAEDMMQLLKKEGLKRIELQKEEEQKRIELKEEDKTIQSQVIGPEKDQQNQNNNMENIGNTEYTHGPLVGLVFSDVITNSDGLTPSSNCGNCSNNQNHSNNISSSHLHDTPLEKDNTETKLVQDNLVEINSRKSSLSGGNNSSDLDSIQEITQQIIASLIQNQDLTNSTQNETNNIPQKINYNYIDYLIVSRKSVWEELFSNILILKKRLCKTTDNSCQKCYEKLLSVLCTDKTQEVYGKQLKIFGDQESKNNDMENHIVEGLKNICSIIDFLLIEKKSRELFLSKLEPFLNKIFQLKLDEIIKNHIQNQIDVNELLEGNHLNFRILQHMYKILFAYIKLVLVRANQSIIINAVCDNLFDKCYKEYQKRSNNNLTKKAKNQILNAIIIKNFNKLTKVQNNQKIKEKIEFAESLWQNDNQKRFTDQKQLQKILLINKHFINKFQAEALLISRLRFIFDTVSKYLDTEQETNKAYRKR